MLFDPKFELTTSVCLLNRSESITYLKSKFRFFSIHIASVYLDYRKRVNACRYSTFSDIFARDCPMIDITLKYMSKIRRLLLLRFTYCPVLNRGTQK